MVAVDVSMTKLLYRVAVAAVLTCASPVLNCSDLLSSFFKKLSGPLSGRPLLDGDQSRRTLGPAVTRVVGHPLQQPPDLFPLCIADLVSYRLQTDSYPGAQRSGCSCHRERPVRVA
jgi:hypothetical protein